jgi:hypothetical protein
LRLFLVARQQVFEVRQLRAGLLDIEVGREALALTFLCQIEPFLCGPNIFLLRDGQGLGAAKLTM